MGQNFERCTIGSRHGVKLKFRSAKSHLFSLKLHISSFNTHPNILGYSQQINCYSLLKWTISRQQMGVNVREWYMRLYNGCTEKWNITVQNLVIIFLWGVSLGVLSINCVLFILKKISSVWNLRKRHEICWKYCTFFVPFFLFSLIF